ncbi:MAG: hypothetical protein IPK70_01290 [Flavobacteriales bacterium]|nr:hypothetical protein [Flavobacteriales bacterium]
MSDPVTRKERWPFVGLAAVLFAYVLLRALLVPFVHDEATSFIAYAQPGTYLPFASMWDANNHYLNSLCGHVGFKLFGLHPLALRWASVLSYLLFAFAAWRFGTRMSRPVRWLLWPALLACPFALVFFSLFRGYGPALALLLIAIEQALRYAEHSATKHLLWSLIALDAALGFMMALLPVASVLLLLLLSGAWRNRDQLVVWCVLGLLPFALFAALARYMASLGLLYQGSTAGYAEVTVASLLRYALGIDGTVLATAIAGGFFLLAIALLLVHRRIKLPSAPIVIGALLLGEFMLRWLLAKIMGLNYAEDRTALHVLLLAVLFVAFAADALRKIHARAWLVALTLLVLPLRTMLTINVDRTGLWPEQSIPERFIARIDSLEAELGRPALVGMHRLALLPFGLESRLHGNDRDGTATLWPNTPADGRFAVKGTPFDEDSRYFMADSAENGLMLYLRREAWRGSTFTDTLFELQSMGLDRSKGLAITVDRLRMSDAVVVLHGTLRGQQSLDLRACVAVFDSAGTAIHADHIMLATRRAHWSGEPWRTALLIPRCTDAARAEVFFWEPQRKGFTIEHARMRVLAMEE